MRENTTENILDLFIKKITLHNKACITNVFKNSESQLQITESLRGKISVSDLDDQFSFFNEHLFSDELTGVFIIEMAETSEIENAASFRDKLKKIKKDYDMDEKIDIKITKKQFFALPLNKVSIIRCHIVEEISSLIEQLISVLEVKDCVYLTKKINIVGVPWPDFYSSLFNIGVNINEQEINEDILCFIKIQEKHIRKISSIPNLISLTEKLSDEIIRQCTLDLLSNVFDSKVEDTLLIFKQSIKKLELSALSENYMDYYTKISEMINFIFSEESRYREKLRITRNLLYDSISENLSVVYESFFWSNLLLEVINEYELYIDEKVTKFISEKKEIIKEQFSMSKEIAAQVSESKRTLMNNLISVIGIFLSKFVLDAISKNDIEYTKLAYTIALLFSSYLLFVYFISGEYEIYRRFENRVKIMNKYYPQLYLTDDNIISNLENKISTPEIKRLKWVNMLTGIAYILIILFFLSRLGFFEAVFTWIITPDS